MSQPQSWGPHESLSYAPTVCLQPPTSSTTNLEGRLSRCLSASVLSLCVYTSVCVCLHHAGCWWALLCAHPDHLVCKQGAWHLLG